MLNYSVSFTSQNADLRQDKDESVSTLFHDLLNCEEDMELIQTGEIS